MISATRSSRAFLLAAGLTRAGQALPERPRPGGRARWERTNHAGRTVGPYAGSAAAPGAALAAARVRPAAGLAVLAAGACGAYDDVAGDHRRGFRAHLRALRDGEVISGAVKLFGISAAALAAGALLHEHPLDRLLAGVAVAGTAHLVNLVDVRPGRAAGAVGAAAAVLPEDLAERTMLGDAGAHALGAALGAAVAAGDRRAGLLAHAVAVVAAARYGDRVSAWARAARG
ncbi:hypothetical protein D9753_27880 [Streptomyces dangxiongensis]|uniref:Uncharacterized protein n=1 Tax=Streptomyces dangxiongensis TaxID=1442032 RepID=A0A3G2JI29_9ACTN|nr:hypothetical protein [Streptomyces dangxiongensis]AYN42076.1 hypothetical protein D9753_27880 [Streptomyces dangxiongensis]